MALLNRTIRLSFSRIGVVSWFLAGKVEVTPGRQPPAKIDAVGPSGVRDYLEGRPHQNMGNRPLTASWPDHTTTIRHRFSHNSNIEKPFVAAAILYGKVAQRLRAQSLRAGCGARRRQTTADFAPLTAFTVPASQQDPRLRHTNG